MKCNLLRQEEECEEEGDSDSEIQQLKQKIRLRRQQIRRSRVPFCMSSQHRKPLALCNRLWIYKKKNKWYVLNILYFMISCSDFHSTDSGGSRRSSQDSYQGLSDSGSAEEVEECELQGIGKLRNSKEKKYTIALSLLKLWLLSCHKNKLIIEHYWMICSDHKCKEFFCFLQSIGTLFVWLNFLTSIILIQLIISSAAQ